MSKEDAEKWRGAIERCLEVRGVRVGQALEHLPNELDSRWFKQFMDGTNDTITRRLKEDIAISFRPNWMARHERFKRESLEYLTDDELLNVLSTYPPEE